eukprot:4114975-Pyramimonas_sp.AAC.1
MYCATHLEVAANILHFLSGSKAHGRLHLTDTSPYWPLPDPLTVRCHLWQISLQASLGAGREAMLCYMDRADNTKLMTTFGFTIPGNPHDNLKFLPPAVLPGGGICKVCVREKYKYKIKTSVG